MSKQFLIILLIQIPNSLLSQFWDTSLLILYSRPFYYNVVKAGDGKIYAGTSNGVFRLDEETPVKIDDRIGYLEIDSEGKVVLNPSGIRFHHQTNFNRLLPFPTENRDEYHAGDGNYLYITSAGRMHVYDIRPYSFRYRNHSVRSISENFLGTYSGIYYKNKLLPKPVSSFTDGYIRELNGKVFMCTNGLDVFDIRDIEDGPSFSNYNLPGGFKYVKCTDIKGIRKNQEYLIAADNQLGLLDSGLKTVRTLYTSQPGATVVLWNEYRGEAFYFSSGNQMFAYDIQKGNVTSAFKLTETILDGRVILHNCYILTSNHLYRQKGEEMPEKMIKLNRAHTLLPIRENEFVISTDGGLYLYKIDENKLFTLIPGVEFNRRALFVKDNKIYAGGIGGLYVLDLSQIDQIIAYANKTLYTGNTTHFFQWIIFLSSLCFIILLLFLLIYRRRIRRMQSALDRVNGTKEKTRLSREEVEQFIINNLPIASLKAINSHLATNTSMVYAVLEPEKPGDLIQKLRYEKVKELRKEGKSAKEIASYTGLSDSYIRKIWNTSL
jgi:outer membrane protein assembly factor BamB